MQPDDHIRPRFHRLAALVTLVGLLVTACQMDPNDETQPIAGTARQVSIGGVRWYVDYEDALELAKIEDKPLWVHFGENPG